MKFINELKNKALNTIRSSMKAHQRWISIAECKAIYANTTEKSPIREFCVDLLAHELAVNKSKAKYEKVAAAQRAVPAIALKLLEILGDLVNMEMEIRDEGPPPDPRALYWQDYCMCHDYNEEEGARAR